MEREKEIAKLVNVLRRTARMAMQSELTGVGQDSASLCTEQYNRVLARLREIDPDLGTVFQPLAPGSSLSVAAMACRQLAAYYEDEVGSAWGCRQGFGFDAEGFKNFFDAQAFKDFWSRTEREIEDFGEFIRQSVEEWARRRKQKPADAPKA